MDKETRLRFRQVQRIIDERVQAIDIVCWIWHLVSNLVKAYRMYDESETPESVSLARWYLQDSRSDLTSYLHKQGFTPSEILEVIRLAQMAR